MCKSRSATMAATPKHRSRSSHSTVTTTGRSSAPATPTNNSKNTGTVNFSSSSGATGSTSSSALSATLSSLRDSLSSPPLLFTFSDISSATNHFSSNRLSTSSWRCSLHGRDTVVFQRSLRRRRSSATGGDLTGFLSSRLAALGKSHHGSLAPLLGASLAGGDHIYLVYQFIPGASLSDCLKNSKNPNFTALSTWISRVQIATDLADGLEYIHQHSGTVHNRMKSSAVIVTDPGLRAKICHFGSADLSGEVDLEEDDGNNDKPRSLSRSGSGGKRIEGTRGYMAPELIAGGSISWRSDVYAFGVVLLELISGEEPLKFKFDKERKEFERISLIETATKASAEGTEGVRRWVDRRLKDSFPVEGAERLIAVALRCVEADPAARPDMTWIAARVSKLYLESKVWEERVRVPTDFSVTIGPR